jgi:hypothetical protein
MRVDRELKMVCDGRRPRRPLSPEARVILSVMLQRRLRPVKAQLAVAAGHVGTAIDVIARNPRGEKFALEIKIGYGDYFTRPLGRMSGALHRVEDSALNHAVCQLLGGIALAREHYPRLGLTPHRALVLRVLGTRVAAYKVTDFPWWIDAWQSIQRDVVGA